MTLPLEIRWKIEEYIWNYNKQKCIKEIKIVKERVNKVFYKITGQPLEYFKNLVKCGFDINATSEDGTSLLMYITRFGRDDLIDYLLDLGVDTDYENVDNEDTSRWYEELEYFIPRYPSLRKYLDFFDEEPAGYYDNDDWYERQLWM